MNVFGSRWFQSINRSIGTIQKCDPTTWFALPPCSTRRKKHMNTWECKQCVHTHAIEGKECSHQIGRKCRCGRVSLHSGQRNSFDESNVVKIVKVLRRNSWWNKTAAVFYNLTSRMVASGTEFLLLHTSLSCRRQSSSSSSSVSSACLPYDLFFFLFFCWSTISWSSLSTHTHTYTDSHSSTIRHSNSRCASSRLLLLFVFLLLLLLFSSFSSSFSFSWCETS